MIHRSTNRIYKNITVLIIGSLLLFLQKAGAQDPFRFIQEKFSDYNSKFFQEKIYVHTDKNFYLAGEIIWFKLYNVDAYRHQPIDLSKVAYVELLDRDNNPVAQAKISLTDNRENGSFHLPVTLRSGNYRLRAYTNWMKNSGPEFFFEKIVSILNLFKGVEVSRDSTKSSYSIAFFPEGGNLVNNITSKVAFKITDQFGHGVYGNGFILDERNDTVARFAPLVFGMGSFYFQPSKEHSYKAIVQLPNQMIITGTVPQTFAYGPVMTVANKDSEHIEITIQSNRSEGEETFLLLGHTRQVLKVTERVKLLNGKATLLIDKNKLDAGITQFTLFTAQGQPECERLFFIYPSQQIKVDVQANKQLFGSREMVDLSIATRDLKERGIPAQLSLAVYRLDSIQTQDPVDIVNYLWLSSDLPGYIESPDYYFSNEQPQRAEAMDHLMLTHGWRRFRWENILKEGNSDTVLYSPEYKGHLIKAKITEQKTGKPDKNIQAFLSIPGIQNRLYVSQSDSNGMVQFDIADYFGSGEIIIQTNTLPEEGPYTIQVMNPFSESYAHYAPLSSLQVPVSWKYQIEEHSLGMQALNIYSGEQIRQFTNPLIRDTLPFFGKPDLTYMLDDYTRFTTMEEVLREYVRTVNVNVRKGKLHMVLFNQAQREIYDEDFLVTLDGVPVPDRDRIFKLDPLKVKKIDIIPQGYIIGPSVFHGVVSFSTYEGNMAGFELDPQAIRIDYEGLQLQREFYSPVYDEPQKLHSRLPDFRSTLYWSPNIHTGSNGKTEARFYTSDQKGTYISVVQGIDNNGHPAMSSVMFEVK